MNYAYSYEFEIGKLWICTDESSLLEISFHDDLVTKNPKIQETELILKVKTPLDEYFSRKRKVFDLPLNPQGTAFQKKVWQALTQIKYGKTCCYKDIAVAVGNPKASRTVGDGKQQKSHTDNNSLPQSYRQKREPNGLRRRIGCKTGIACT